MISFVCWKWRAPNSDRSFEAAHVNVLRSMVARHYPRPHRFVCVTDDAAGLDADIVAVPLPVRFDELRSPSGERFPNCYCRLWSFSKEAREVLGPRIFSIDIDAIIVHDLQPLVDRTESFVGWCDPRFRWRKIAGGVYMLETGTMTRVWESFDPLTSPAVAFKAGNGGSDQGWMSYCMYPPPGHWTRKDGLVKLKWTKPLLRQAPPDVRIAFTSGLTPPWSPEVQRQYPWIREHWR